MKHVELASCTDSRLRLVIKKGTMVVTRRRKISWGRLWEVE